MSTIPDPRKRLLARFSPAQRSYANAHFLEAIRARVGVLTGVESAMLRLF